MENDDEHPDAPAPDPGAAPPETIPPELPPVIGDPRGVFDQVYPVEFTARTGEYFRIWIVNLALTILTLGIYSAWATVRKRRYFHGHTLVAGDNFEYHGNPIAILKGRVIAVVLFGAYSYSGNVSWTLKGVLAVIIAIAMPWLIVRSLAFNAYNTTYRNIRFAFRGTYWEAFKTLIGNGLLTLVTIGFFYPGLKARMQRFVANNHYFGNTRFNTESLTPRYFATYGVALVMVLGAFLVVGILVAMVAIAAKVAGTKSGLGATLIGVGAVLGVYGCYFLAFAYLQSRTGNILWNSLKMGGLRFASSLRARSMAWLYFTNIVAVLLSLGMATPWAVVRTMRYRFDHLKVITAGSLDEFTAGEAQAVGATGEEVGEMFGFDIAL